MPMMRMMLVVVVVPYVKNLSRQKRWKYSSESESYITMPCLLYFNVDEYKSQKFHYNSVELGEQLEKVWGLIWTDQIYRAGGDEAQSDYDSGSDYYGGGSSISNTNTNTNTNMLWRFWWIRLLRRRKPHLLRGRWISLCLSFCKRWLWAHSGHNDHHNEVWVHSRPAELAELSMTAAILKKLSMSA